jgi:putative protease
VRWENKGDNMNVRLNDILIDQFGKDEKAGYPTICKGRFEVAGETYYAMEGPASLNLLEMLPEVIATGVAALKVEGRQRSPMYVAQVTRTLRQAIDAACGDKPYAVTPTWANELAKVSEGSQITLGAYNRPWR